MSRPKGSKNKIVSGNQIETSQIQIQASTDSSIQQFALAADIKNSGKVISTYEVYKNYRTNGDLKNYDIDKILMNKQENVYKIYELLDYYSDKDSIISGSVKRILSPFSYNSGDWYLQGKSEQAKKKITDYFRDINFDDLMRGIFYVYFLFGNVFLYDRDSWIDVFPVHRVAVNDIKINGEPVLSYQILEFYKFRNIYNMDTKFIDTVEEKYKGMPQEVQDAVKNKSLWAELNPENTFAIQMPKAPWERYAINPMVSALKPLSKKNLIGEYENAILNIMARGFLHVQVGDKEITKKVSPTELAAVGEIFKQAISGFPIASTAWNVQAKWLTPDDKNFDLSKDLYATVNKQILEACGLSSLVVSGNSDGSGSFAQATVSTSIAEKRIQQARDDVAQFINKLIAKRAVEWRMSADRIPEFKFNKISLQNDAEFRKEVLSLFQGGILGYESTLEKLDYNYEQERERKKKELENKDVEVFTLPPSFNNQKGDGSGDSGAGAPTKPVNQSKQDKNNSQKNPKPSNQ